MKLDRTVVVLLVVVLLVCAWNAYVSTRVAVALSQVNSDIANAKVSVAGWRKLLGI